MLVWPYSYCAKLLFDYLEVLRIECVKNNENQICGTRNREDFLTPSLSAACPGDDSRNVENLNFGVFAKTSPILS